jgi:undecaprenyl-phosphate 4-deoxy-4-formamido-L-arabinose transferase
MIGMQHGEFETMYRVEGTHWWYRGLRDQVLLALGDGGLAGLRVLDAGCGAGRMLEELSERGALPMGLDISSEALRLARRRGDFRLARASVLALPVARDSFDACVCLDVLSNVEPKSASLMLEELYRALRPGGVLILNTAAGQWLYGEHDRAVGVKRRYSPGEVRALIEEAGFEDVRVARSNSMLFPAAAAYRLVRRLSRRFFEGEDDAPASDLFSLPAPLESLLFAARRLENRLITHAGLAFPFGLSVFATARRPDRAAFGEEAGDPGDKELLAGADVSVVIPVYNAEHSVEALCEALAAALPCRGLKIVLVNDGSGDLSHEACLAARARFPQIVVYLRLSRNFGEHNAVMAGLGEAGGNHTIIIDDDFQNPPEDAPRLLLACLRQGLDVAYGAFKEKRHGVIRNLGSLANGIMAQWLLGKPRGLYLSSFKCLSRFAREQALAYKGPAPYLDGLLLRTTDRVGHVEVTHRARRRGVSGYTWRKLANLWLTAFMSFSPAPARLAAALGAAAALAGVTALGAGLALWSGSWALTGLGLTIGGVAALAAGLAGEYASRALFELNAAPQYVVRERYAPNDPAGKPEGS